MMESKLFKIACSAIILIGSAAFSVIRDEIFRCDQVRESNNYEHHKILRDKNQLIRPLALKSIPQINPSSKTDRDFFVKAISSVVKKVNEIVIEQRKLVLLVQKKRREFKELTANESEQFKKICYFYQTKDMRELLLRVAPVPVSLAVAQAALESKFGSDRTMHQLNAYFGLAKSKIHLVKFDSLFNSVIAYIKTLNVNPCYNIFRQQRALMLNGSKRLDGVKLASCLGNYCTNRKYSDLLCKLIETHKLYALDQGYTF
ncbi:MAG: glucosaminidase domain-containing protein [Holosporaceae bacterium]|jgi:Bax protein|nr:glucosaminidase domain-containing protein [Holosporaceae bacterium]